MDNEGEQRLAVAAVQRLAWRYFRSELSKTGTAPTFAAMREWVGEFEGTRMSGPMFGAAQMGPLPFDLEDSLREWYADWVAGRFLEPIEARPTPLSVPIHPTPIEVSRDVQAEVLPDDATAWNAQFGELEMVCGWIASGMRECMEMTDELKRTKPGLLTRLLGKTHGSPGMLLRSRELATAAFGNLSYIEAHVHSAAQLYGQPPAEVISLHKTGAGITVAIVALYEYLSGLHPEGGRSESQSVSWTEFEIRYTTGTLRYLEFVRAQDLRNDGATDSSE